MSTPETPIRSAMELTDDMHIILDYLEDVDGLASTAAVEFCTSIPQWRVEIDADDMADAGWVSLSRDADNNTIVKLIK